MNRLSRFLGFADRHKGTALFLGGFASMTAGATWWLASGGLVALTVSMAALNDPDVAQTLSGLPEYHQRVEAALSDLAEGQEQITDALETFRRDNERIVEWAPEHSQRLTDEVGGCFAGEECVVYLRGRRTQSGASCDIVSGRPVVITQGGRELPLQVVGSTLKNLTTRFETMQIRVAMPTFLEPGTVGIVVFTVYADCPFVAPGELVDRRTFRLLVEIKPSED